MRRNSWCLALTLLLHGSTACVLLLGEQKPELPASTPERPLRVLSPGSTIEQAVWEEAATRDPRNSPSNIDILSDTMGVDFRPYLAGVLKNVRQSWYQPVRAASFSAPRGVLANCHVRV